jgi:tetratricopeptide (TPR) repeat protein
MKNQIQEAKRFQKLANILKENDYQDYLDTHYDSDGMDDYKADKKNKQSAEKAYDKGLELYKQGNKEEAEEQYQLALEFGSHLGWDERELPPYNELKELDSSTQGAIGIAMGGTITLAIAIKETISLYKKLKQQNPEISNKELILKTLSSIAHKIQNSK